MNQAMLVSIVYNVALLLALGTLYAIFPHQLVTRRFGRRVLIGCVLALITVALMLNPWPLKDGLVFDVRSILLAITGLFFGVVPTVIVVFVVTLFRLSEGGIGVVPGIAVTICAAGLGLCWRYLSPNTPHKVRWVEFYLFGLAVHVLMLLCMFLLPWVQALQVLRVITLPVLLLYPVGTVLICALLAHQYELRQIAQALRESEEKYRILVQHANEAIYVVQQAKFMFCNAMFLQMVDMPEEQVIGMSIYKFLPEESHEEQKEHHHSLLNGDIHADSEEIRILVHEEVERWVSINSVRIFWNNQPATLNFATDITERKQAEGDLRNQQRQLQQIFDILPVGLWFAGKDGTLLRGNPMGINIWGAEPCVNPADYGMFKARRLPSGEEILPEDWALAHTIKDGVTVVDELLEIDAFDGKKKIILNYTAPLLDDAGNLQGAIIVNQDVSAKKYAEDALIESEARYRRLTENSPDIILRFNQHCQHLYASPTIRHMTDLPPEAFIGKTYRELNFSEHIAAYWENAIQQVFATGQLIVDQFEYENGDRRQVFDWRLVPEFAQDGTVESVLSIARDITEHKLAEEERIHLEQQIQQTQKLESLGVMAGGIAHDFNNILMAISGYTELLSMQLSPGSEAQDSVTQIITATNRAAELCRQMLAYSGKASFAIEKVDLGELVEEMSHLLKTTISKKALLNLHINRPIPSIQADPSQIRQIVMNLIINASDAIGEQNGFITVSVDATYCDEANLRATELYESLTPGLYVHLEIADNGCGMDIETRTHMFEPFYTTKFTGRGLGLAAVLGIVRAHKGALKVSSEPNKGTIFTLLFPSIDLAKDTTLSTRAAALSNWRGSGTVLLVDDEESIRNIGARMLKQLGFTVLTATDGQEALACYQQHHQEITLVVMDMTMPHMDGSEAFNALRQLNPRVRVVLASGYSTEDIQSRFNGKGLNGILQKPFTLDTLRETIRTVLEETAT